MPLYVVCSEMEERVGEVLARVLVEDPPPMDENENQNNRKNATNNASGEDGQSSRSASREEGDWVRPKRTVDGTEGEDSELEALRNNAERKRRATNVIPAHIDYVG